MHKVAILVWDMGLGGVQRQIADMVSEISESRPDWELEVWIKNKRVNYYPELTTLPRVTVISLAGSKGRLHTFFDFFKIGVLCARFRPDVVLTFHDYLSIMMILLVKLFRFSGKSKLVIFEPNFTSHYMHHKKRGWYWDKLIRMGYPLADWIVTTTETARDDLRDYYGIPEKIIQPIPTWSLVKNQQKNTHLNPPYDVVFLGRLEEQKRPEMCLALVDELKNKFGYFAHCAIGGDGVLQSILEQEIRRRNLGKQVELCGPIKPGFVSDYLCKGKIFILPSIYEGMPLSILEAGGCGLPTIVTSYPGVNEVVKQGKTGFIVDNVHSMAEITHRLLTHRELRMKIGSNAKRYVRNNHGEVNLHAFINLLS